MFKANFINILLESVVKRRAHSQLRDNIFAFLITNASFLFFIRFKMRKDTLSPAV